MNTRPMPDNGLCYIVIGHPIAHSLSPRIHAEFARQCGRTLDYRTVDAAPAAFTQAVQEFFASGGAGANVTLPHKAAAFALADEYGDAAARSAVANVLTPLVAGGLQADNTDGVGLLRDLRERHGLELSALDVVLLGAGGAARGVAPALLDAGIASLSIVNRTPARAHALADRLADPARIRVHAWQELGNLEHVDLVLNSTSAGVHGQALDLPRSLVSSNTICYDLSYGPAAAPFMDWARRANAPRMIDGLGMLVETAAASFDLWHGVRPDTDLVFRSLVAGW